MMRQQKVIESWIINLTFSSVTSCWTCYDYEHTLSLSMVCAREVCVCVCLSLCNYPTLCVWHCVTVCYCVTIPLCVSHPRSYRAALEFAQHSLTPYRSCQLEDKASSAPFTPVSSSLCRLHTEHNSSTWDHSHFLFLSCTNTQIHKYKYKYKCTNTQWDICVLRWLSLRHYGT